ncbi:unnamed protein product [Cylindrotheca closterium]|uniref:Uncharacterized protein n=1 Tax=Cylindrotheca closterium TaxID=2856 RepID=A0AAD2PVM3_9STRA|nr:unnamed protein product [Cylindrotheca closterium]
MKFHLYLGEAAELLADAADSEQVEVQEQVKLISHECFIYWDNLRQVRLPQGLQVIEQAAFAYCKSLLEVHIPSSVKVLQDMAFVDCSSLTTVWLSDAIQVLEQSLFENCVSLKDVHLPLALTTIKESCFASCKSLRSLRLPHGLQRIGDWAMARCFCLTSLTLPATVDHLGRYCFQQCAQLLSLEFPMGLSFIGDHCFVDCSNLRSMIIPGAFEFAGSYPLLDRSLLKIGFQDYVQGDSYEDETLVRLLNNRFESLPIHDACYHLSQHQHTADFDDDSNSTGSLKHLQDIVKEVYSKTKTDNKWNNLQAWITGVDGFGMNPLHLLCLSGAPNAKALQLLLDEYATATTASADIAKNRHHHHHHEQQEAAHSSMLHDKDIFGGTPLAYLCWNHQANDSQKLCQAVFDSLIVKTRLPQIRLKAWKQVISKKMSYALEHWDDDDDDKDNCDTVTKEHHHNYCDRLELVARVFFALEYHERKESLSLLECWLWKLQLQGNDHLDSSSPSSLARIEQTDHQQEDRQQCRIHCGADVVIPNVLSFLPPLKEGKYLKEFTTK